MLAKLAASLSHLNVVTIKTESRVTPFQSEIQGHQVFFGWVVLLLLRLLPLLLLLLLLPLVQRGLMGSDEMSHDVWKVWNPF